MTCLKIRAYKWWVRIKIFKKSHSPIPRLLRHSPYEIVSISKWTERQPGTHGQLDVFLAWVTNWLPLTLYSWKTISMVQRSKHAPWKCKLEHFGLQKSGAYRMIHSLHNQTELLPEIQLAYTDIHFLENWSSIQIDSFVAHKQRNDSAQLLNRSKLEHLRHSIPRYIVKNILTWSFFNFLTLSEWFVEQFSIWLTNFYSHKSLWIWYQGNWLRIF